MRELRHILAVLALISVSVLCCACERPVGPDGGDEQLDAMAFASELGLGWNLGNSLDAYGSGKSDELAWGNGKSTQKTFNEVKALGFGCVRIPVTWFGHIGAAPEYKLEKAWLDRVAEVVSYAHKAGLKVIINIHHDGAAGEGSPEACWLSMKKAVASVESNAAIQKKLSAVWKQIAARFKDEGDWLVFETMNEIHDGGWGNGDNTKDNGRQYGILNVWNQVCLDAIRSAGGKNSTRFVAVAGYAANPQLTLNYLALPKDSAKNRLMVAFHTYDPWDFAGAAKYDEWGHTGKTVADKSREMDYTILLDGFYNKYVSKGIPVYAGECGCVHRSSERAEKFRKYYIEYTVKAMRDRGIVPFVWDNGNEGTGEEAFGLIRHNDGVLLNNAGEIIALMAKAWSTRDESYTLESIYKTAPF